MSTFFFSTQSAFSGQIFYEQWSVSCYNLAFTALPVMALGASTQSQGQAQHGGLSNGGVGNGGLSAGLCLVPRALARGRDSLALYAGRHPVQHTV